MLRRLTLAVLLAACCGCAAREALPGGLSAAQYRQLAALPMPIALPEYAPPGFAIAEITVSAGVRPQYSIEYRAADGRHYTFNGAQIEPAVRKAILAPGVPRTLAKELGQPDDVKTDRGCTLAATHPFEPGRNGLVFTVFGCDKDIRPGDVVRVFESARFVNP